MTEPTIGEQFEIIRLRNGDHAAREGLFARCGTPLYQFLWAMSGDETDAAELTVAAFATAFEDASALTDGLEPSVWLHRVAFAVFTGSRRGMFSRKAGRQRPDADPNPTAMHEQTALQSALVRAIQRLPEQERCAVALHSMAGWNADDIALVLRRPPGDVTRLLTQAHRKLRNELQPFLPQPNAGEDESNEQDRR